MTVETDVLVVGGGIAGASTAYHLAALGHTVTLLERGEIASGASGVNGGLIDSVRRGRARDLHAHLTAGSLEIFEAIQGDFGVDIAPPNLTRRDGPRVTRHLYGRQHLWIVSGLASSGFGRGPMAGKLLADSIHAGAPLPLLAETDPTGRIRERATAPSSDVAGRMTS